MSNRSLATLFALLLMATALAGCAAPEDAPTPGTDSDDPTDTGDGADQVQQGEAVPAQQARATFLQAVADVQSDAITEQDIRRMGFTGAFDTVDEEGEPVSMTLAYYMDADANEAIMTMEGELLTMDQADEAPGEGGGMFQDPFAGAGSMMFASIGKTAFFGATDELFGFYNESAEPVSSWKDFGAQDHVAQDGERGDETGDLSDPFDLFAALEDVPEDAEIDANEATYQGRPALDVRMTFPEGNGTAEVHAVVFTDTELPAFMEVTLEDPTAQDPLERAGTIRMDFHYGEAATHEDLDALRRLSSLVVLGEEDANPFAMGGSDEGPRMWTIQASDHSGTVALDEVTLEVREEESSVLTLMLEDVSAENDQVRVTFDDVDGDGHVSEGDTITVEDRSGEDRSYSIALKDETTGMVVVPAFGWLAALLVATVVALAARRR